jgi:hypothetical protein
MRTRSFELGKLRYEWCHAVIHVAGVPMVGLKMTQSTPRLAYLAIGGRRIETCRDAANQNVDK